MANRSPHVFPSYTLAQSLESRRLESLQQLDPNDQNFAVDAVDIMLAAAIDSGASDLHLHPRSEGWDILLRIDGVLSVSHQLGGGGSNNPVTRLMVLAGLPTYRSSQPMEGRIQRDQASDRKFDAKRASGKNLDDGKSNDKDLSMRLGVFPTVHGPRGVVRFLRRETKFDSLDTLGLSQDVVDALTHSCDQTDGAILLSGPAGSGKTTTLYAMLRRIAASNPRRSVMTIEDPVESIIASISQSELDASGGLTLASALRSAVRQDSEVLLVSEIRDPETAEAAMQASLTGHLIFSSLHAADVAASLRRLVQFGVPASVVQSGIRTIVSQRLLRKLCVTCHSGDRDRGSQNQPVASGTTDPQCPDCSGTRYRGRVPIAQCVQLGVQLDGPVSGQALVGEALIESLQNGESLAAMRAAATKAGGMDLRQQAQILVDQGITDEPEVFRVLGRPSNSTAS